MRITILLLILAIVVAWQKGLDHQINMSVPYEHRCASQSGMMLALAHEQQSFRGSMIVLSPRIEVLSFYVGENNRNWTILTSDPMSMYTCELLSGEMFRYAGEVYE